MSIKCYWGSNGSYKSASAVQYDIIPELKKGRVVITNIRGCTLENCMTQYPEIPGSADIIYIDTEKAGSYEKMRTWFRWAPHGALIVIDEVQLFHLKSWRDKDLEKYILRIDEGEISERIATEHEAEALNQPYSMLEAFTKHRHFNWDLVFTTPHIKYLREDIRNTTEVCYRQANGALLGFSGRFKRSMHDADENKPKQGALTQTLKINQKTFKCYESTKTGKTQDTRAGTNIFKSPRLLLALLCCFTGIAYSISSGGFDVIANKKNKDSSIDTNKKGNYTDIENDNINNNKNTKNNRNTVSNAIVSDLSVKQTGYADDRLIKSDVFKNYDATIIYFEGYKSGRSVYFLIEFDIWKKQGKAFTINSSELLKMGYRFKFLSDCALLLQTKKENRLITCWKPYQEEKEDDMTSEAVEAT